MSDDLSENDKVDAFCVLNKVWYEGKVVQVRDDSVRVHFLHWASRFDEWIPKKSNRLAPVNTHTSAERRGYVAQTTVVPKCVKSGPF